MPGTRFKSKSKKRDGLVIPVNNRAVGYARVSTKRQDAEGYSLEDQQAAISAYAKQNGLEIVKWFQEAASAWKPDVREEFNAMVQYVDDRQYIPDQKICHAVYKYADRNSRNLPDFIKLEKLGIHLHNLESGRSFNPSNPDDYEATANEEHRIVDGKKFSGLTSKKVRDAVKLMVQKGDYPGAVPPLGYRRNPLIKIGRKKRAGQIEIDPERGPLIKKMFLLYRTGEYDYRSLAKKMYSLGLRSKKGRFVNHSRIESYLSNPFYCGRFEWNGELCPCDASHPRLIEKELWDEVQQVREEKSRQTRTTYAGKICKSFKYSGLKCSLCGCAIVGEERHKTLLKSGKAASYVYYHCCQAKERCELGWFTEQELDLFFDTTLGWLEELNITEEVYEKLRKILEAEYNDNRALARQELDAQRKELDEIQSKLDKLDGLLLMKDSIQPSDYNRMKDKHNLEKTEVQARIIELEREEENFIDFACESLKLVSDFRIKYLQVNPIIRKKLNSLLFKTMTLTPKQDPVTKRENAMCLHLVWNEPFTELFKEYKAWFLETEKLEEEVLESKTKSGGADETRTRDLRRDRPAF